MEMRNIRFAIHAVLVGSIVCLAVQVSMAQRDIPSGQVRRAMPKDVRSIEISKALDVRLFLRKRVFRLEELVDLHLAVINKSTEPVFISRLDPIHDDLHVVDSTGSEYMVFRMSIDARSISTDNFELLKPGHYRSVTIHLLPTDGKQYAGTTEKRNEILFDDSLSYDVRDRRIFDDGLFVGYGDARFMPSILGTYRVSVELENAFVVVQGKRRVPRTVTGSIVSNEVEFELTAP
jgi:hypothetical protein